MVESEAVAKIKRILDEVGQIPGFPKLSEATTCEAVISRLMREVGGYKWAEYVLQPTDAAGAKPDYEFLPGTACNWYLEAKAWNAVLSDVEAAQALGYANTNGRRWVVLSSGREWRLYDNTIMGTPSEKLVAQADDTDIPKLAEFLRGISKESVQSGRIADYALSCRLAWILDAQLQDPNSDIVQVLVEKLNGLGLAGVTGEHVVRYFRPNSGEWPKLADLLKDPKQGASPNRWL